jgi:hypothetical protein
VGRERGRHESERERDRDRERERRPWERVGGRKKRGEERRLRAAEPVRCRYHRPEPAFVVDGGVGHAHSRAHLRGMGVGHQEIGPSGAEAARTDLVLGQRREEAGVRLVSGARAEWGDGTCVDLALGQRRDEAGARSVFALLGCAVEEREVCGPVCFANMLSISGGLSLGRRKIHISSVGPYSSR